MNEDITERKGYIFYLLALEEQQNHNEAKEYIDNASSS
ncbi:hypothetical protein h2es_0910 [Rickettsiales endosymbiont of Trichoplax sp. H2]|nr:hypothetical protein [Rickettsiales endosymbiont of Trichoplax sp. H2]